MLALKRINNKNDRFKSISIKLMEIKGTPSKECFCVQNDCVCPGNIISFTMNRKDFLNCKKLQLRVWISLDEKNKPESVLKDIDERHIYGIMGKISAIPPSGIQYNIDIKNSCMGNGVWTQLDEDPSTVSHAFEPYNLSHGLWKRNHVHDAVSFIRAVLFYSF